MKMTPDELRMVAAGLAVLIHQYEQTAKNFPYVFTDDNRGAFEKRGAELRAFRQRVEKALSGGENTETVSE